MPEFKELFWSKRALTARGLTVKSEFCQLPTRHDCEILLEANWRDFHQKGSLLFQHVQKPELLPLKIPGLTRPAYAYAGPLISELWHVPKIDAHRFVPFLICFGFPRSVKDADSCLNAIQQLIEEESASSEVSITQVDEQFITLEKAGVSSKLSPRFVDQCVSFNEAFFGVNYDNMEGRDIIRNWKRKSFVNIGGI